MGELYPVCEESAIVTTRGHILQPSPFRFISMSLPVQAYHDIDEWEKRKTSLKLINALLFY